MAAAVDTAQVLNPADVPAVPEIVPPFAPPLGPVQPAPGSPSPRVAFEGGMDDGTSIPPDTMGAVGDSHLFNPLNNWIRITDRVGSLVAPRMRLNDFWQGLSTPMNTFDPRVIYDPSRQRFLFASMANAESPDSGLLLAVSKGSDPTQGWTRTFIRVDPAQQPNVWLDFPSLGFSADKVTVQVNLYSIDHNDFLGSNVYVWDKASLYDPPFQPRVQLLTLDPSHGATQAPAVTYDPLEQKQYLVARWTGDDSQGSGAYAVYEVTGNPADGTTQIARTGFVRTPGTTWDSFVEGDFGPQQGTAERINTSDDRILSVLHRDGSLWFSHAVYLPAGGPTRTAAQWLQVDTTTWTIQQLGRVDDPSGATSYAFPTLAVNADGDALLGLATFGANQFASGGYVYRAAADAPGTMRSAWIHAPGQTSYFKTFEGDRNRWGDYSSTQVDPVDDKGFWTIQEYASLQPNVWATRWAQVP